MFELTCRFLQGTMYKDIEAAATDLANNMLSVAKRSQSLKVGTKHPEKQSVSLFCAMNAFKVSDIKGLLLLFNS